LSTAFEVVLQHLP